MKCKLCGQSAAYIRKHGFYTCKKTYKKRQRYKCRSCHKTFCARSRSIRYRQKKEDLMEPIFQRIASGMSQRRMALELGTTQKTIARKLKIIATIARDKCKSLAAMIGPRTTVIFDEMETFEHTKCKPLSIVTMVDEDTRTLMELRQCRMPAKGLLAKISREKYGPREDKRPLTLRAVLKVMQPWISSSTLFKSDECPRYPKAIRKFYTHNTHLTFKGRRACVVGQGELKAGGFDPLFKLNHTCAMVRDNIKRLSRKTWCTTKKPKMLQKILDIYRWFHNQIVRLPTAIPHLFACPKILLQQQQ